MVLEIVSLADINKLQIDPKRRLLSATHEEILGGATTDVYFVRTFEVLESMGLLDTPVTAEIFCHRDGLLAGVDEVMGLLEGKGVEVWALPEGSQMRSKEVVMRIRGGYREFG
ncbi:MAG: nicotinate phosphoribosyltransferase, partial [Thermacetogeniaceae bacterium]